MLAALAVGCGGSDDPQDAGGRDGSTGSIDAGGRDGGPRCARDSDCDDGVFCNGPERCMPGSEAAASNGCVDGAAPCTEGQRCDEGMAACIADNCAGGGDVDGDGDPSFACGGADCDDDDPRRFTGNAEACDGAGLDEDCDETTIHSATARDGDRDGDGFIDVRCFNTLPDGTENRGTDCDDTAPTVNPGGVEACDGRDNDCDGEVDEGVQSTYYLDSDGDNYGSPDESMPGCTAPAPGWVLRGDDCDDGNALVHPNADEPCNGEDDDCDGMIDEEARTYYRDNDGDGYGSGHMEELCPAADGLPPDGWSEEAADCHDGMPPCTLVLLFRRSRTAEQVVLLAWETRASGAASPRRSDRMHRGKRRSVVGLRLRRRDLDATTTVVQHHAVRPVRSGRSRLRGVPWERAHRPGHRGRLWCGGQHGWALLIGDAVGLRVQRVDAASGLPMIRSNGRPRPPGAGLRRRFCSALLTHSWVTDGR